MTALRIVVALVLLLLVIGPQEAAVHASNESLKVTYIVNLDQHFDLYGSLLEQVSVEVSGTVLPHNNPTLVTVLFPFTFSDVAGLAPRGNYSLAGAASAGLLSRLTVEVPGDATSFTFILDGTITGFSSLFFRDIAGAPPISVSMNAPPFQPTDFNVLVPQSQAVQIRSVQPSGNSQVITLGGRPYLQLDPRAVDLAAAAPTGVSILYQSSLSNYYSFFLLAIVAIVALLSTKMMRSIRPLFERVGSGMQRRAIFRRFRGIMRERSSRSLLAPLMLVCVGMIFIAMVFGPPPQPRVYLAATPATTKALAGFIQEAGWSYLDVADAADGFNRAAPYGMFSAVIVADYPPPISGSGISEATNIIAVRNSIPSTYLNQLLILRPLNTIVVDNPSELVDTLTRTGARQNVLGLSIAPSSYVVAAKFDGILSILVPFFALAFFAGSVIEMGARGFGGILELVVYSMMVYFLAEFAFIVSSMFLGTPVALHAAISNKETAVGLLGPFGGGTRPREVSGLLGFVFGVFYTRKGSLSVDRTLLGAIVGAIAFLIVDPLNIATTFYELLLVISSNVGIGASGPTYEFLRGLIGQGLNLFQSSLTSGYVASHGATVFFVSAVPFILYSKVRKGTSTILLLFSAIGCAIGFIRIGDMVPLELVASIAPGLVLGVLLIPVFLGASFAESVIRRKLMV